MKKILTFAGIIVLLIAILIVGRFILGGPAENKKLIGGDKDEHGCIGSAGYQWCPSTEKCQKMWEEYCYDYKDQYRVKLHENQPDKSNLIQVDNIKPNQAIGSPLTVTGQARGTWFFEGDFPIMLVDWDGKIMAESYAQFQGEEWMTENFVPFKGTIEFTKPDTSVSNRGTLILKKDNPSDQRELDDALEIPIIFE